MTAETTTRILLVEDHKLIAEMMYSELAVMANCVVDVVHDADEAESRICQGQRYDVVLLDYVLPGSIDLDVFERLKELNNGGVVLFSGVADPSVVERAISMGAAGYIPKSIDLQTLRLAIQIISKGGFYFPTNSIDKLLARHNQNHGLKSIETQVLVRVVDGLQNKQIANDLEISEVTVKMHLRSIFKKLGARNRTEAALKARSLGIK